MPLPEEILKCAAAANNLKEAVCANLFSHVVVAAQKIPGGMVRVQQVLLPWIEKATADLQAIDLLFRNIAEDRSQCERLVDAFEAARIPKAKLPLPVPTEQTEPTAIKAHWKLYCHSSDGREQEFPFFEGDLMATLAKAAKNAAAANIKWTDAVVLTAATIVNNVWQWRVHPQMTAKAQAMLCEG